VEVREEETEEVVGGERRGRMMIVRICSLECKKAE
jgi:hypothetical protein